GVFHRRSPHRAVQSMEGGLTEHARSDDRLPSQLGELSLASQPQSVQSGPAAVCSIGDDSKPPSPPPLPFGRIHHRWRWHVTPGSSGAAGLRARNWANIGGMMHSHHRFGPVLAAGEFYGTAQTTKAVSGFALSCMAPVVPAEDMQLHTHRDATLVMILEGVYISSARDAERPR